MRFEAEITDLPPSLGFDLPFDPKAELGKVRAPVRVTINGFEFRTTVVSMSGRVLIGLNKDVQRGTGVTPGDLVAVDLVLDEEPRTVEVPADLVEALDEGSREFLAGLSYTHRKEYARWIEEAKWPETRRARIEKAAAMLRERVRHP